MIEMIFVLVFIGILTSIAVPRVTIFINDARVAASIGDIRAIQVDIVKYAAQFDSLPATLATVGRGGTVDPWGQPYVYNNFGGSIPGNARTDQFGVAINSTYDLYSVGEDGATAASLLAAASRDDIVSGNDGGFIGLGTQY